MENVLNKEKLLYPNAEGLEEKCRHSSATERKAMEAERESVKYKQVEYMTKHVGESFDGVITGVTSFGIFNSYRMLFMYSLYTLYCTLYNVHMYSSRPFKYC